MVNIFAVIILFIFYWVFTFTSCNSQEIKYRDLSFQKIDSIIEVYNINEQCILIKFGYDALTAINTKMGIVVIDAGISTGLTEKYKKVIENKFQRKDFIYVINTHSHSDHVGGNSVFTESCIIGQINCQEEISKQNNNQEKAITLLSKIVAEYEIQLKDCEPYTKAWEDLFTQKTRYLFAYNDAKNLTSVKMPDITFHDSLKLDMGDISIEMVYFGNCHSTSDILIYVPEMRFLFTGDLFSTYGKPSVDNKLMIDKDRWQQAINWTEKRMINIEKIINGHGQILTINDIRSFNNIIMQ